MEPCYTSFTLHQRQFIIATHEILHAKGWQSLKLSDEFILSFQSALRIESVPNRDRKILLLGERYAIAELPSHEKLTELCSGRFAIIEWPYIYGDATNLLSIFYSAASGEPIISSSPALLAGGARRCADDRARLARKIRRRCAHDGAAGSDPPRDQA